MQRRSRAWRRRCSSADLWSTDGYRSPARVRAPSRTLSWLPPLNSKCSSAMSLSPRGVTDLAKCQSRSCCPIVVAESQTPGLTPGYRSAYSGRSRACRTFSCTLTSFRWDCGPRVSQRGPSFTIPMVMRAYLGRRKGASGGPSLSFRSRESGRVAEGALGVASSACTNPLDHPKLEGTRLSLRIEVGCRLPRSSIETRGVPQTA